MSAPDAVITGMRPSILQRCSPTPCATRSNPEIGRPFVEVRARQIISRSQARTSSAPKVRHVFSLISPCMRRRTVRADNASLRMACSR